LASRISDQLDRAWNSPRPWRHSASEPCLPWVILPHKSQSPRHGCHGFLGCCARYLSTKRLNKRPLAVTALVTHDGQQTEYRSTFASRLQAKQRARINGDELIPLTPLDFGKKTTSPSLPIAGCRSTNCGNSACQRTIVGVVNRDRMRLTYGRNSSIATSERTDITDDEAYSQLVADDVGTLTPPRQDSEQVRRRNVQVLGDVMPSVVVVRFNSVDKSLVTKCSVGNSSTSDQNGARKRCSVTAVVNDVDVAPVLNPDSVASFEESFVDGSPTSINRFLYVTSGAVRPETATDDGYQLLVVPPPQSRQSNEMSSSPMSETTEASVNSDYVVSRDTRLYDDSLPGFAALQISHHRLLSASLPTNDSQFPVEGDRLIDESPEQITVIDRDARSLRRRYGQSKSVSEASVGGGRNSRKRESLVMTIWRRRTEIRRRVLHDRKAARTLSAVLLAFIVTWAPYNIFTVIHTFSPLLINPTVYSIGKRRTDDSDTRFMIL